MRPLARIRSTLDEPRYAWVVLGIAMAISAVLILIEGAAPASPATSSSTTRG